MNQGRTLIDTGWTLALVYVAYIIASLSMHLTGWTMVASQTGIHRDGQFAVAALFVTTIGVAVLSSYITPRAIEGLAARLSWRFASLPLFTKIVVLLFLAATAPVAIAYFVLDRFPNSGDEFAYLFQGTLFAKGHLWASAPPLGDAFVPYRTWVSGDKWLSQYPPGWPLALALALVAGIPVWSLNGLLGAATVAALMSPLWQFPNRGLALVAAGVYVLTPFYLLNAASYHSHVLTALLILLLCLCCLWYQRNRRMLALVAGGALLGLIGVTRYFALILVLPALCYWLIRETHHARIRMIAVLALAGMPFLCLLLLYQYFITGNPFRSTYALITVKDVEMSFALKDILHGAKLTIYRLVELEVWASPVLMLAYFFCVISKIKSRSLAFYDVVFPSYIAGYVFFATMGGNRYGPRYYFEAFPLMLVTIASSARQAAALARGLLNRPLAFSGLLAGVVYLLTSWPFVFTAYHDKVASRQEVYRLASAHGLSNAIVIVRRAISDGMLAADLARNDVSLEAPILFARPQTSPEELHRLFPHRSIWIYESGSPGQFGTLVQVRP